VLVVSALPIRAQADVIAEVPGLSGIAIAFNEEDSVAWINCSHKGCD
jgi:hypothetical protein